jgi:hypothetical protein
VTSPPGYFYKPNQPVLPRRHRRLSQARLPPPPRLPPPHTPLAAAARHDLHPVLPPFQAWARSGGGGGITNTPLGGEEGAHEGIRVASFYQWVTDVDGDGAGEAREEVGAS